MYHQSKYKHRLKKKKKTLPYITLPLWFWVNSDLSSTRGTTLSSSRLWNKQKRCPRRPEQKLFISPQKSKAMDSDKKLHLKTEWMRTNQSKTTGMVGVAKLLIIYIYNHPLLLRLVSPFPRDMVNVVHQWFLKLVLKHQSVSSVAQSCPTLCDPMNRSTLGLLVHHQLPEFIQTHVHQVSDAIQPSHLNQMVNLLWKPKSFFQATHLGAARVLCSQMFSQPLPSSALSSWEFNFPMPLVN